MGWLGCELLRKFKIRCLRGDLSSFLFDVIMFYDIDVVCSESSFAFFVLYFCFPVLGISKIGFYLERMSANDLYT